MNFLFKLLLKLLADPRDPGGRLPDLKFSPPHPPPSEMTPQGTPYKKNVNIFIFV